ncbi:hypothetical protein AQI95_28895 [Streptomyces yokosukanensis]|uniref:Uncharacterized protein n=1 Tax=Streptomyces yokosukanensis TaxID=67386 RepID=A0A117Q0J6_9ACTN|nr:hypothetical protein [Streptomyces yokosukanensis]KUN02098.1 hypothetical protein AQI95_28895 [Streptomyces yokosukanensis]
MAHGHQEGAATMRWLGRKRDDELRAAAYRAQLAIVANTGHMAWTAAWKEPQSARRHGADVRDAPRTITGPLLAGSQQIDEALRAVSECVPPSELTEVVNQARRLLEPLLELRPVWIAHLTSPLEGRRLSEEELDSALGMDMDFGGFLLEGWDHEETAISAAIAVAPLLDQVHEALTPYSGCDWLTRAAG